MCDGDDDTASVWFMRDTSWSRVGLPLALGLLLLAPSVQRRAGRAATLVYLQLPAYMLHQYEEHAHGAFKRELNALLPPTFGQLTDRDIFWTNVLGVWGVDSAAIALACTAGPATGLVAPYLAVVNSLLHIGAALAQRRYNPGLGTGALVLLPIGIHGARAIGRAGGATRGEHVGGLLAAIVVHALVIAGVVRARRRPEAA